MIYLSDIDVCPLQTGVIHIFIIERCLLWHGLLVQNCMINSTGHCQQSKTITQTHHSDIALVLQTLLVQATDVS